MTLPARITKETEKVTYPQQHDGCLHCHGHESVCETMHGMLGRLLLLEARMDMLRAAFKKPNQEGPAMASRTEETKKQPLTKRQAEVLTFLIEFTLSRGYQPSMREIADHFGWSSKAATISHFKAFERKGWIEPVEHRSRAVRVIGGLNIELRHEE